MSPPAPGRRDRDAVAVAFGALRAMIVTGRIAPGTELSQVGLANQIGVSTTPLREALARLEAEGLVESRRNRRPRVPPFDPADLDAVYCNRVLLESLAVAQAVPLLVEEDLTALRGHLDTMRVTGEPGAWDAAHGAFHFGLVAPGSRPLTREVAALMARSDRYRRMSVLAGEAEGRRLGEEEHEAILSASASGLGREAALLLARHLTRSALTLIAHLAPDYDPVSVRGALQMVISWAGSDTR